jgi:dienelactone hydrolase
MGRRIVHKLVHRRLLTLVATLFLPSFAASAEPSPSPWNIKEMSFPPAIEPADLYGAEGVQAVFMEGEPWQGKPTKVFAYYGLPENATRDAPVPGVVCVHGGGGTAYAEWVKLWNKQGFAAIAIDTNGAVPKDIRESDPDKFRHEWAGPRRYGFDQAAWEPHDQWPYHAVAAIMRANSLLGSLPEVDASNIGVTGISWGGYLTSLVAGVDPRFKFAIPVYGCGYVHEGTSWNTAVDAYGRDQWVSLWDPSSHLDQAQMATLWVNGTNDAHYHMPLFQKTYQLPKGPRSVCIRVRMDHGHGSGWSPPEIYAFANSVVGRGEPLVELGPQTTTDSRAIVEINEPSGVTTKSAELHYTVDSGPWINREWKTIAADLEPTKDRAVAAVPAGTTACFFNVTDSRGLMVSSEHADLRP